ncbi:MAG: hypothetical protein JWN03_3271 [Nocardia sp.]|nr:hypothetical protein [Nocardia sp.]
MWYLIDAAEPEALLRYVPEEGTARWRSLYRAVRPNSLASLAHSAITRAIETHASFTRSITIRGTAHSVVANPINGLNGRTLAVQLWAGDDGAEILDPPQVDAFVWDGQLWTLISAGAGGSVLPASHNLLHGAWFLSRIIECERRDQLITAAIDPQPDTEWQGPIQILTADDARTARVAGCFRYHEPHRLRGLLLQVEHGRDPGIVLPTYHNDATVALLGGTTALIDMRLMQIIEWLTPPLPQIAWRHHPASGDTVASTSEGEWNLATTHLVHPDDKSIFLSMMADLATGRVFGAHSVVRLLTVDHDWLPIEIYTVPLPSGFPGSEGSLRFFTSLIRPAGDLPIGRIAEPLRKVQL